MAAARLVQPQVALKRRISRRILSRRDILYQILLFGVVHCGIRLGVLGACACGVRRWLAVHWPVRPGAGALRGEPEHPVAYGRQVHREGVVPAIDAAVGGVEALGLTCPHRPSRGWCSVRPRRGSAGRGGTLWAVFWVFMTQRMGPACALAQHAYTPSSRPPLATHSKRSGVIFARIEGRLGGVEAAEGGEILLESVVEGILEQAPVQLPLSHSRKWAISLPMKLSSFCPGEHTYKIGGVYGDARRCPRACR